MKDPVINNSLLHLYRRAGFGSLPEKNVSIRKAVSELFRGSEIFAPIKILHSQADAPHKADGMSVEANLNLRKDRMRKNREEIRDLNAIWISKMASGETVLRERMSLFWHGHFACRVQNAAFVESYINTIRKNALGSFADLLLAVSKEPAMLQFLNNQQNRKNKPNENFAREVMELFTLGRGNYTEMDVKEGARAFTGWGFDGKGEFQFRENLHDNNTKKFLGKDGNFQGEDIIKILLEQKQTARFVTAKIYRSFVSEVPDNQRINSLAESFYKSNYDISQLMRTIFSADWYYEDVTKATLIKSPVELVVGIQRTLGGAEFADKEHVLYIQKVLGQVLFYPPNVAGWPGGRNWIDSSSLLFRMQLPYLMAGAATPKVKAKESGHVNDQTVKKKVENAKIKVDWTKWASRFGEISDEKLLSFLSAKLLAVQPKPSVTTLISDKNKDIPDRTERIRKLTLSIMSLPEYQIN